VIRLLAHIQWFSPGTPASSTTKTGRHDIAKILLKVALNINKSINQAIYGSACTKPGKWEVMCQCDRVIDVVSFYDCSIGFWNCSDFVVSSVFHFITTHFHADAVKENKGPGGSMS
jgi:hypothetical protein